MNLQNQDPEIFDLINAEAVRQQDGLEMIASENYTSVPIMEAAGSVLTNKYAEGYPGRRYYGGCEHVDVIENIARDRAKELFGAEAANVQPNSGSQANQAVYLTALEVGDTVLGLDLAHGGHLTHGMRLNLSGKLYNFINYGVKQDDHRIDFDQVAALAKEHKPKMIDRCRSKCLPARDSSRKVPSDRRRCRSIVVRGHGSLFWLGRRRSSQQPSTVCRFCNFDDTQDAPRSSIGNDFVQKEVAQENQLSGFPWNAGWPLDAHRCWQSSLLRRVFEARVQNVCSEHCRQLESTC